MATQNISSGIAGSGKASYGEYSSILHIGGGYRGRASFDCRNIPSGATVTGVTLYMTHTSNVYAAPQNVLFSAASSGNWNYSSRASEPATSVRDSGNVYKWVISPSFGQTMIDIGTGYLHMSSSDSQDRPYGKISISIEYTEALGMPLYRWNGEGAIKAKLYRWNGEKIVSVYAHSRFKEGTK